MTTDDKQQINSKASDFSEVMGVREVCQFLGFSENTVRRMVASREIPFHKVRRRLKFIKVELLEWLKDQ